MKTYEETLNDYKNYIKILAKSHSRINPTIEEDLYQEGIIALYDAYNNYDENKGFFPSFAQTYIIGRMMNYITDNNKTVRIPASQQYGKYKNETLKTSKAISTDLVIKDDGTTIGDVLSNNLIINDEINIDSEYINGLINNLSDKKKDIILMYFGFPPYTESYSFRQIGKKYNNSPQNIQGIFAAIIKNFIKKKDIIKKNTII